MTDKYPAAHALVKELIDGMQPDGSPTNTVRLNELCTAMVNEFDRTFLHPIGGGKMYDLCDGIYVQQREIEEETQRSSIQRQINEELHQKLSERRNSALGKNIFPGYQQED